MKKIFIFTLLFCASGAFAADPSTSCPSGFTVVVESNMIIANGACPSGYTSVGSASSCLLSSPSGSCMMFAPAGTTYTDTTGGYEFTEVCPLS